MLAPLRSFESYSDFDSFMKKANTVTGLIKALKNNCASLRLLDIGCNKGFLLHSAIQHGWDVSGIELIAELLIPFKNKHRSLRDNILIGDFNNVYKDIKPASFDVITAIDVIEHFPDPLRTASNIRSLLKQDGIFVVQTPDTESSLATTLKSSWGALKWNEHLCLFNKHNYTELAKSSGFAHTTFY